MIMNNVNLMPKFKGRGEYYFNAAHLYIKLAFIYLKLCVCGI